ncbi:MAG: VOC family protein [Haliea sp.]
MTKTLQESELISALPDSLAEHIVGLAHVGHIVKDLSVAVANFKRVYGLTDAAITYVPPLNAAADDSEVPTRFAFVDVKGTQFELIEPASSFFKDTLLNMPSGSAGINHVAFQVEDLAGVYASLQAQGIRAGHVTPQGIVDTGAKKMLYLDPETTGGLVIELIEIKT